MKLGPVTKLDKRNTGNQKKKKIDDDVILENFDVIAFSLIYGQFAVMRKPDF